jgi:protein-tyrosine phosphatase
MLCHACYGEPEAVADCAVCRGTGRATRMPLCAEPWNEVVPGLWQGGHDVRSQSSTACVVGDEFDLVVSLTTRPGYGPAEGVEHVVVRLADAGVDAGTAARLDDVAATVAEAVDEGRRVLVRCSGGLNRSGLVVALALQRLGRPGEDAVALVRAARGPWALTNPGFVAHLRGRR